MFLIVCAETTGMRLQLIGGRISDLSIGRFCQWLANVCNDTVIAGASHHVGVIAPKEIALFSRAIVFLTASNGGVHRHAS